MVQYYREKLIFKFVNIVPVSVEGGMIREKSRFLLGKKCRSLIVPRSFRARCDVFVYRALLSLSPAPGCLGGDQVIGAMGLLLTLGQ